MGFLNPLNLLYGLSLAALVLIYLHARSRSTIEVSSLMLFDEIEEPRAKPRLARVDLLFWLELLTLAVLSMAVAGLYLKLSAAPHRIRRHALIFDVAAGMGAREGNRTRLDLARRQALAILSSAPAGDQFSVLAYAREAESRHAMSGDRTAVRAAIESLRPLAVAGRPAALTTALMLAREADLTELFADRLPASAAPIGGTVANLRFHQVGSSDDNLAIASLEPGTPGEAQGRCVVRNFSAVARKSELAIDCDGREVYRSSFSIAAHGQTVVPFGPLSTGGLVHARLLTPDALEADNDRWAYVTPSRAFHALVVSPDAEVRDDLARILRAVDPNFVIAAVDPAHLELANPAHFELAVMHEYYDERIHADSRLLIYPASARELTVGASVPYSEMEQRADSGVAGHSLLLGATRAVELPAWMEPLARGSGPGRSGAMPLAALGANRDGRLGVIAFDIRNHLLLDPDRIDVLVLTVDLIKALAALRGLYIAPTGSYVRIPAIGQARVVAPDGTSVRLGADQWGQVRFRPMQAGRYRVSASGRDEDVIANYYDAAESDLAPKSVAIGSGTGTAGELPVSALPRVRPIGFALIVMAMLAFLSESAILVGRAIAGGRRHV